MKGALLVIDYINGIAEGSGSCAEYLRKHHEVLTNTNLLIDKSRELELPVIFIRLAFEHDYEGLPKHAPIAAVIKNNHKFLLGTSEVEFISGLDFRSGDIVCNKKYGDPFFRSELMDKLQKLNVEHVIFTGVATDNAIQFGAGTAMLNDFYVTIVSDACASTTKEAHEVAIKAMNERVANQILITSDLLKVLI